MKASFYSVALLAVFLLSGCGQYGSLYLPGSKMDKSQTKTMVIDTAGHKAAV